MELNNKFISLNGDIELFKSSNGVRICTPAEWEIVSDSLMTLSCDIDYEFDPKSYEADEDIPIFDRLTPEHRRTLLAGLALALSDPTVLPPSRTAATESAMEAILGAFWVGFSNSLDYEGQKPDFEYRQLLLAAFGECDPDDLPSLTEGDKSEWNELFLEFESRFFPRRRRSQMTDVWGELPREPMKEIQVMAARQTLARVLNEYVMNDDGEYEFIRDCYHGLTVGPCNADEIAAWQDLPWIRVATHRCPFPDVDYEEWRQMFSRQVPSTLSAATNLAGSTELALPEGISIESVGSGWIVQDQLGRVWSHLLGNEWTDASDSEARPLKFGSEHEARSAYCQAILLYAACAAHQKIAFERIGVTDPEYVSKLAYFFGPLKYRD